MDPADSALRRTQTTDGTTIAYRSRGSGPGLLFARGWVSHLKRGDEDPAVRAFFGRLEQSFRVVRYDGRGNGLSDRELPEEVTIAHLVQDLQAVADAAFDEPFVLWASSWAGPAAICYAAEKPDRVSAMVLDGTFCSGASLASPERAKSFLTMLETARFQPDAVYASMSYMTDPEPGLSHDARIARTRESIDPDALFKLHTLLYQMEVTDDLDAVDCPTLILHRRGSRAVPVGSARALAAGIAGSTYVELEGRSHNMWEGDTRPVWEAVSQFLNIDDLAPSLDEYPAVREVSIVFIDQVASTYQMRDLGDMRGVEVQSQMIEILTHAATPFGAEKYSDTGDGVVLLVASAAEAVALAQVVQRRAALHNQYTEQAEQFRLRIGIHTGEIHTSEAGRTSGLTIAYAARLCDLAETDQILASDVTYSQAVTTVGAEDFTALEEVSLKGIGEVAPHAVTW